MDLEIMPNLSVILSNNYIYAILLTVPLPRLHKIHYYRVCLIIRAI